MVKRPEMIKEGGTHPMDISAVNRLDCTGCLACVNVCPMRCILPQTDAEGFLHPVIRQEQCVHCGKCYSVCPACQPVLLHKPLETYAAFAREADVIRGSTSGGVFFLLARHVIEDLRGYVCGAVMNADLSVKHILVSDMAGVRRMQGSKYVQSDVGNCYRDIAGLLALKIPVLFCGTPCQVAGLRNAVGSGSENLYTADLICHGVPAPAAFREYMGKHYRLEGLQRLTFREQVPQDACTYCLRFEYGGQKNVVVFPFQDPFYQALLDGASFRESCYRCNYARAERTGDITLGDCANANAYRRADARFTPDRAVSTVACNTPGGLKLWQSVVNNMVCLPADYKVETRLNRQLHAPVERPMKREAIYSDFRQLSFQVLQNRYCPKRGPKDRLKHWMVRHSTATLRWKMKRRIGR